MSKNTMTMINRIVLLVEENFVLAIVMIVYVLLHLTIILGAGPMIATSSIGIGCIAIISFNEWADGDERDAAKLLLSSALLLPLFLAGIAMYNNQDSGNEKEHARDERCDD